MPVSYTHLDVYKRQVYMCSYFLSIVTNGFSAMLGLVVLAVGIWLSLIHIYTASGDLLESADATGITSDASSANKQEAAAKTCLLYTSRCV